MLGALMAVMLAQSSGIDYGALVHEYRSGHVEEAVTRLAGLDPGDLDLGFKSFMRSGPSASLLTTAAAMETEAALRPRIPTTENARDRHLLLAGGIVELGTRSGMWLGVPSLKTGSAVSAQFRRIWFLAVITAMEWQGRIPTATSHLENARRLFPHDAEMLLLSGIGEEMRASNRMTNPSEDERRKALASAEVYYRESLDLAPDRVETRLRLGWVLFQRGRAEEARPLLTAVSDAPDPRPSYLGSLFLGGLEDAAGNTAAAARWYARAANILPTAQAARLGGSELHHRAGEHSQAAEALPAAIGSKNTSDPWWTYLFGEYWRLDIYLDALRKVGQS